MDESDEVARMIAYPRTEVMPENPCLPNRQVFGLDQSRPLQVDTNSPPQGSEGDDCPHENQTLAYTPSTSRRTRKRGHLSRLELAKCLHSRHFE